MSQQRPRGLDHVGLTVRDAEAASKFLVEGLGAAFLYETLGPNDPPIEGEAIERGLGMAPGSKIVIIRMYALGIGPGIEIFQYDCPEQRDPARSSDLGWQHIAVYTDDLEASVERFVAAGGEVLAPPRDLPGMEGGPNNRLCYMRTPFGTLVEMLTYPSPQPYEQTTPLRRWHPPASPVTGSARR